MDIPSLLSFIWAMYESFCLIFQVGILLVKETCGACHWQLLQVKVLHYC